MKLSARIALLPILATLTFGSLTSCSQAEPTQAVNQPAGIMSTKPSIGQSATPEPQPARTADPSGTAPPAPKADAGHPADASPSPAKPAPSNAEQADADAPADNSPATKPALNADGSINFSDAALKKAVKAGLKIKKSKIFPKDVASVKYLDISDKKIQSLDGMQYFTKAETLYLSNNHVSDLGPIKNLTTLDTLIADGNAISDLTPLSNLKNLTFLVLDGNLIENIGPLATLTKLQVLSVTENRIVDISPLTKLVNLAGMPGFRNNLVRDYSPLKKIIDTVSQKQKHDGQWSSKQIEKNRAYWEKIYKKYQTAVSKVRDVDSQIIHDGMSDLEKEYAIANYLMSHVSYAYDWDRDNPSVFGETAILGHVSIYDVFFLGQGICDSYAISFVYLARMAGLDAYYVESLPSQDRDGHAWNIVEVDGKYYQVDLTWADTADSTAYDYSYINVSNKTMTGLHNDMYPLAGASKYPPTTTNMPKASQSQYYLDHK